MNTDEKCQHTEERATGVWACVRPAHPGSAKGYIEAHRRRRGKTVNADRHVLINTGRTT